MKSVSAESLGRSVFGPILAEFTADLLGVLASLPPSEAANTQALFCARGGLRLQYLYERFLAALRCASPVPFDSLMVSRIMATRAGIVGGSAAATAEVSVQFAHARLGDALDAVAGQRIPHPDRESAFDEVKFRNAVADDAGPLRKAITNQVELFRAHLDFAAAGRSKLVLIDTGLYGSTLRMLSESDPDHTWSCLLLARSNNKAMDDSHFEQVIGLSCEEDSYSVFRSRSVILRHWHLIEAILEPPLPSVTRFHGTRDAPRSNLEVPGWHELVAPAPDTLYAGICQYFDSLGPSAVEQILDDAPIAWRRLKRTLRFPTRAEVEALHFGEHSADFGTDQTIASVRPGLSRRQTLTGFTMWRPGEIAMAFSADRIPVQLLFEAWYWKRDLTRLMVSGRDRLRSNRHAG